MSMVRELYSQREQAKLRSGQDDVFQYDVLPAAFRAQVDHLLEERFGSWNSNNSASKTHWTKVFKSFIKEKGVYAMVNIPEAYNHRQ
jgi:hypothetical protein